MNRKQYEYKYKRSINGRYSKLKTSAKQRGKYIDITLSQYTKLVSNPCYYCKESLPATGSGLDRKDPNKPYTLKNCVPCCTTCNMIKGPLLSFKEARIIIKALIKYWKRNKESKKETSNKVALFLSHGSNLQPSSPKKKSKTAAK